jgi:DHA1 family tetracycline resistance protein-like MFS transporter
VKPLGILFFVVVVDLLGFGIIIPLFPYMAIRLGATPEQITPILAVYSACQFIAAPLWGRLSDRFGRRPILMSSMAGAALSYVMLAFGDSIGWLIASRVLGGAMAGNISAAMAYAADVTREEERARGMGIVGAAIGMGFMLGPALGGVLAGGDLAGADFQLPALVAAALSTVALMAVALGLPESLTAEQRARHADQRAPRTAWRQLINRPALAMLVGTILLVTIAHSMLESIVAIWAMDRFGFGPRQIGFYLLFLGALMVSMQGGAAGRLARRYGEKNLALAGVSSYLCGLLLLAFAHELAPMIAGGMLCGLGAGAYLPSLSSLVSKQAEPQERGVIMGTYQSATSLARIIGPTVSGAIYAGIAFNAPFLAGVLVAAPALVLIARSQARSAGQLEQRVKNDHGGP